MVVKDLSRTGKISLFDSVPQNSILKDLMLKCNAAFSVLLRDVWACFSVQKDLSAAEELTVTSEYGGNVFFSTKLPSFAPVSLFTLSVLMTQFCLCVFTGLVFFRPV